MSFFKDFKADLSQAVNELLPDEKEVSGQDIMAEEPQMVDTFTEDTELPEIDSLTGMFDSVNEVTEAVADTTEFIPEFTEPVAAPALTEPTPVLESEPAPVVLPESEPAVVTPEPAAPVAEAQPQPAEVSEPESVPEEKVPVAPVFAQNAERPAPINTTMEDFSMETGIIIAGMSIKGDVNSEGSLDVRGNVTGNINILGKLEITGSIEGNSVAEEVFADGAKIVGEIHSNGSVKIGQETVVKGNITATSAVLAGAIKGDIDVQGPVILDTTAIIMGNIKSKSIQINNGAVIEGLCSQCYADVSPMSFFGEDKKAK